MRPRRGVKRSSCMTIRSCGAIVRSVSADLVQSAARRRQAVRRLYAPRATGAAVDEVAIAPTEGSNGSTEVAGPRGRQPSTGLMTAIARPNDIPFRPLAWLMAALPGDPTLDSYR